MNNRIKSERALKGMSQKELGDRLGVSSQTVAKWEKNIDPCPVDKALMMIEIFGCGLDYLVGNSETRC